MSVERHYFPGNNTPKGFFSYYNYILSQREAEKIICLKGGPGTGKSTFLRKIAEKLIESGENVDFLHCSADDNSLDGILAVDKKIALIDGTRPHVIDPITPGAVDSILNFGEFWDECKISRHKEEILNLTEEKKNAYAIAYNYLKAAKAIEMSLGSIYEKGIEMSEIYGLAADITDKAYRKYDITVRAGHIKKFFATAITPNGFVSYIKSLLQNIHNVYLINSPEGYKNSSFMNLMLDGALYRGFNVEVFYCPMSPETKIEHILIPELSTAFVTTNRWHDIEPWEIPSSLDSCEISMIDLNDYMPFYYLEKNKDEVEKLSSLYSHLLKESIVKLGEAKKKHDALEKIYIQHIDFDKVDKLTEQVINEII